MTWAFAHAPAVSRQTVSTAPETASASYPPAPSTAVPAGTAGSACPLLPGPPMTCTRPAPSSTHALPPAPNPDARGCPAPVSGAETVPRPPSYHAANRLVPAASSAVVPLSRSTCTRSPLNCPGSTGPSACHVPLGSGKTPATPARAQLPATPFKPFGQNDIAFIPTRPQLRPAGDAASARTDVSCDHDPPAVLASTVPFPSSASCCPDGAMLSASGTLAKAAGSTPAAQFLPVSVLVASGENASDWLALNPMSSEVVFPAAPRPPLSATPGGVTSDQRLVPAGRTNSCQ